MARIKNEENGPKTVPWQQFNHRFTRDSQDKQDACSSCRPGIFHSMSKPTKLFLKLMFFAFLEGLQLQERMQGGFPLGVQY